MKALVVYDSVFGNTEKVAQAIGEALGAGVMKVGSARPEDLSGVGLLVVGSPTRAFSATPATKAFLAGIAGGALKGARVTAFDTRLDMNDPAPGFLKFLVRIFGFAAKPIARGLVGKGGSLAAAPEGFLVAGTEGPLKPGELERAAEWGRRLAAGI